MAFADNQHIGRFLLGQFLGSQFLGMAMSDIEFLMAECWKQIEKRNFRAVVVIAEVMSRLQMEKDRDEREVFCACVGECRCGRTHH